MKKKLFRFQSSIASTQLIGAHYFSSKKYLGKKTRFFFLQDLGACHEDYEDFFYSLFERFKNKIEIYTFDYLGFGRSLGTPSNITDLSICLNDFKIFINKVIGEQNNSKAKNILCGHKIGADLALTFSVNIQPYFNYKFEQNIFLLPLLKNPMYSFSQLDLGKSKLVKVLQFIPGNLPVRFDKTKCRKDLVNNQVDFVEDTLNRYYELSTIEAINNFYQDFYSHSYFLSTCSLFILEDYRLKINNAFLSGIDRSLTSIKSVKLNEVRFHRNSHRLKIGNKILLFISKFIDKEFNINESGHLDNASL